MQYENTEGSWVTRIYRREFEKISCLEFRTANRSTPWRSLVMIRDSLTKDAAMSTQLLRNVQAKMAEQKSVCKLAAGMVKAEELKKWKDSQPDDDDLVE